MPLTMLLMMHQNLIFISPGGWIDVIHPFIYVSAHGLLLPGPPGIAIRPLLSCCQTAIRSSHFQALSIEGL